MRVSRRRRAFAVAQFGLGLLVFTGSAFEVVNLLFPTLVPEIQSTPLMQLHHSNRVVFYWTLLSNLVTSCLGLLLCRAAVGTFKGDRQASTSTRKVLAVFSCIVVGASVISGVYLLPPILAMLHTPADHSEGVILLVSVLSAIGGLAFTVALLFVAHSFILAKKQGPIAA